MIRAEVEGSDASFGLEVIFLDDWDVEADGVEVLANGICVGSFDSDFFFRVMGKACQVCTGSGFWKKARFGKSYFAARYIVRYCICRAPET